VQTARSGPGTPVAVADNATVGGGVGKSRATDGMRERAEEGDPADDAELDLEGPDDGDDKRDPATRKAIAAAQRHLRNRDLPGAIGVLEAALVGNPDDIDLLFNVARLNMGLAMADPEKPDLARLLRAADSLGRMLKADPKLVGNPGFRSFAGMFYFDVACALGNGGKPDESLKILREAVDVGFTDFSQLEKESDLESVRALAEFPEFLTNARAAYRERLKKEVPEMMAATMPFDFDFELTDIEGKPIAKRDFKGKVLIVDLWGTWCPPCIREIPHFVELQKKFEEAGLAIVGLNSERAASDEQAAELVREFHKEFGMNYRCAVIKPETLDRVPDFEGFPTTLFFDRSGKLRARVLSYHDYDELETIVQTLLDETPDPAGG
jgi:thiol-disulfide isomerase/thioredoxin